MKRAVDNSDELNLAKFEYKTWKYLWLFMTFDLVCMYFLSFVIDWGSIVLADRSFEVGFDKTGYLVKVFVSLFS